jgi:hypothetical protein
MILSKMVKASWIQVVFCLFMAASVLAQGESSLIYENQELGAKIVGPEGWCASSGKEFQERARKAIGDVMPFESLKESAKNVGVLVTYSKYPIGTPVEYNPNITLSTEPLKPEYSAVIKTALDYAKSSMLTMRTMLKDFKMIEEPSEATVNGRQGAYFVYEGTIVMGYLELRCKSAGYVFLKGNLVYAVTFIDKADNFNSNLEKFKSTIQSFILK